MALPRRSAIAVPCQCHARSVALLPWDCHGTTRPGWGGGGKMHAGSARVGGWGIGVLGHVARHYSPGNTIIRNSKFDSLLEVRS